MRRKRDNKKEIESVPRSRRTRSRRNEDFMTTRSLGTRYSRRKERFVKDTLYSRERYRNNSR